MSDRGMKKWAPYKSLEEQNPSLINMKKNKTKIEKPLISNEEAEEINEILVQYHNERLIINYFRNGEICFKEGILKTIDPVNRLLILEDKTKIKFIELVKIQRI